MLSALYVEVSGEMFSAMVAFDRVLDVMGRPTAVPDPASSPLA